MIAAWHRSPEPIWQRLLLAPLVPLSWVFGLAVFLRAKLGTAAMRPPVPVISVGNLVVGGAGKTPVVIHLATLLRDRGLRVAVLSRGYGGSRTGPLVVSRGEGSLATPAEAGDEAVLVARRCPGVCVLVGPRRGAIAEIAVRDLGAQILLLDDGFQHASIARDLDIVVLDGASPFGNGRLLPRGPLRELPRALERAHLVWIAKSDEGEPAAIEAAATQARASTGADPVRARYVLDATDVEARALRGRRVLLLAAIARPSSFRTLLERAGATVVGSFTAGDHHGWTAEDVAKARRRAQALGAELVCCTEKDAVKISEVDGTPPLTVVRIRTEVVDGGGLERLLSAVLPGSEALRA